MYAMLKTFYTSRHLAPGGSEGSIGGIPAPLAELELAALPPCLPDDVIEEELRALVRVDPVPELRNGLLLESVIWNGKYVIQMFFVLCCVALAVWHSGHRVRLNNRRSRVRIPLGGKLFVSLCIIIVCI
jgi:hypothetical protein